MCSSTRGPAMAPSLVTWPDDEGGRLGALGEGHQAAGHLAHLADGARRRAELGQEQVWMESMASAAGSLTLGGRRGSCRRRSRRRGAEPRRVHAQPLGAHAGLAQRLLAGDVERRAPSAASRSRAARRSVLLPMPGSPPSSTSEPGTTPPPSTRSSSAMPVSRRDSESALTSASGTGRLVVPERPRPAASRRARSPPRASSRRCTRRSGRATWGSWRRRPDR